MNVHSQDDSTGWQIQDNARHSLENREILKNKSSVAPENAASAKNSHVSGDRSFNIDDITETDPPIHDCNGVVQSAIAQMSQNNGGVSRRFSYVLLLEDSKLVGIITESDVVKLTAAGVDLAETKIDEVMTKELITLKKSDTLTIHSILAILRQSRIRHLPIIDNLGYLLGVVSVETICQTLHPSNLLKFRRVHEAMTREVLQAPATASVLRLSQMMAENKHSCIVIVDSAESKDRTSSHDDTVNSLSIPIGIVTERDIVQFQMLGMDIANTIAQTIMSTPLVCMKTTDSLRQVRSSMEKLRVRRLVIVGDLGELRGMVTQSNMLKVLDPAELFDVIQTLQQELEERTSRLQQAKELAQVTLQSIGDAVITTDAMGKIINLNPTAEKLTGFDDKNARGKACSDIFHIVDRNTREILIDPIEKVLQTKKTAIITKHTVLIAGDRTEYAIEGSATPIRDNRDRIVGAVIVFRDVTKSRRLNDRLFWQANHDALTGLYNRREFEKKLAKAIGSARDLEERHILCYLDLDRFKIVNDTCGHVAGDELLKQITRLLIQQVRSSDTLARLGGDEFGFLLDRCPLSIAIEIANNIRQWIEDFRFSWEGKTFSIGVSIGLVEISSTTGSLKDLINTADAACYIAKANGRNCIHVYRDDDDRLAQNLGQEQWLVRLNRALEEDHFCLYAQKIASLKENLATIDRYEILLRLPDRGQMILPEVFLPAAERYNLMAAIDCWVVRNFLTNYSNYCQNSSHQTATSSNKIYTINLSKASINSKQFCGFVKEQLDLCRIDPATICFEISETTITSNLAIASKFIAELRELGCSIALDNFSNSVSSPSYLEKLSLDYLKIDGSLVKTMATNKIKSATVKYLNHIAQIMEIETVAGLVENSTILRQLQKIGIDYAQGYEIAKPIPLGALFA